MTGCSICNIQYGKKSHAAAKICPIAFIYKINRLEKVKIIIDDISSALFTRLVEPVVKKNVDVNTPPAKNIRRFRADTGAWTAIALACTDGGNKSVDSFQKKLAEAQLDNGSVPLLKDRPEAAWPTPLAVIAWSTAPQYAKSLEKAVQFLLTNSGEHWNADIAAEGHDTSIRGWPWIYGTHSWVEPTAMTMIALKIAGYRDHPRVIEAVKMIMNRQLPAGGWNYGNTRVLGNELFPMPESTGIALSALSSSVPRKKIEKSIQYLQKKLTELESPISLGWVLMGLNTWGVKLDHKSDLIKKCFDRQKDFGPYSIHELSLLLTAACTREGIIQAFIN